MRSPGRRRPFRGARSLSGPSSASPRARAAPDPGWAAGGGVAPPRALPGWSGPGRAGGVDRRRGSSRGPAARTRHRRSSPSFFLFSLSFFPASLPSPPHRHLLRPRRPGPPPPPVSFALGSLCAVGGRVCDFSASPRASGRPSLPPPRPRAGAGGGRRSGPGPGWGWVPGLVFKADRDAASDASVPCGPRVALLAGQGGPGVAGQDSGPRTALNIKTTLKARRTT